MSWFHEILLSLLSAALHCLCVVVEAYHQKSLSEDLVYLSILSLPMTRAHFHWEAKIMTLNFESEVKTLETALFSHKFPIEAVVPTLKLMKTCLLMVTFIIPAFFP